MYTEFNVNLLNLLKNNETAIIIENFLSYIHLITKFENSCL